MASPSDSISMALFCDFENVALGVRDAQYEKFDIKPVLERLLLKGSIVVKKAYCDWERYKGFKATMHEANFELIEIPHVRQSGKNSADIRLVVDALDLCYTKSHVNTFVIISGDSDFSPLVSKLRENNKQVIGVGVKQSTSDLLIANCDEFIFYDDLVRENQRAQARRQNPGNTPPAPRRTPEEERHRKESQDARRAQGVELAAETFEALLAERGDSGKIWASVLKEAIKRRKPDFSEGRYGFRTFGNLLEEAQARGLLEFGRDEKSGAYVYRGHGTAAVANPTTQGGAVATVSTLASGGAQAQRTDAGADRAAARPSDRHADRLPSRAPLAEPEPAEASLQRQPSRYFSQPMTASTPEEHSPVNATPPWAPLSAVAHGPLLGAHPASEPGPSQLSEPVAEPSSESPPTARRGRSATAKPQTARRTPRSRASDDALERAEPVAATASATPDAPVADGVPNAKERAGDAILAAASGEPAAAKKPARPRSRARKPAAE